MQNACDDKIWLTFRQTDELFVNGQKSTILINLKSTRIEQQIYGEIAGCYSDGNIEYLAVHKPDIAVGQAL